MRALSAVVSLESVLKIAGHTRVVSPHIEFANENVNVVKLAGKRGIVAILSPKWLACEAVVFEARRKTPS